MDPQYTSRFLETVQGASAVASAAGNQGTLLAAFGAVVRGDFDSLGEFLADDVELHISGSGLFDGTWRGRKDVVAAARSNYGKLVQQKPEIEAMIAQCDSIAVLLREAGVVKADQRSYRLRVVQWFTWPSRGPNEAVACGNRA